MVFDSSVSRPKPDIMDVMVQFLPLFFCRYGPFLGIMPFYALRVFDVMKKAFDITLGAIADLVDVTELLRSHMIVSDSHAREDLQKIISLLEKASNLAIDALIVFGKYENLR